MADRLISNEKVLCFDEVCKGVACIDCPFCISTCYGGCKWFEFLKSIPTVDINLQELEDRYGKEVRFVVEDMISGEGKRWKKCD